MIAKLLLAVGLILGSLAVSGYGIDFIIKSSTAERYLCGLLVVAVGLVFLAISCSILGL